MNALYRAGTFVAATGDVSRRIILIGAGFGAIAATFASTGWNVQTQAQAASPVSQSMEELNAMEVIYNHPEDSAAFQDYLMSTHFPLVTQVPDIKSLIVHSHMVVPELVPGDIYQIGTVIFGSQAEMERALASEQAQAAFADIPNFATGGFTAYLAHVDMILDFPGAATPAS